MKKVLTIREYDTIMSNQAYEGQHAYLPEKQFEELHSFLIDFKGNDEDSDILDVCRIGFKRTLGTTISVCNYVGTIQTENGCQIEILPKIALSENDESGEKTRNIFLKMLRSLREMPGNPLMDAKLRTFRMNLYEIFITMYIQEVDRLVKQGLKSSYVGFEENLNRYKGKLLVKEHIRKNCTHKERFYVAFDEFHINRPENQVIKAALNKLLSATGSSFNQKRIRELLLAFETVEPSMNHLATFSKISLDRSTRQYENALMWSKVFLMDESFSTFAGHTTTKSLLFPMEKVFESYVAKSLKRAVADTRWTIKTQARGKYLFEYPCRKFALRPDIIVTREDKKQIILDTKWKRLFDDPGRNYGISQSDMYQMFAYAHRYETSEIWLLYPKNEDLSNHDPIIYANSDPEINVHVFFVDLENINESMNALKHALAEAF